MKFHQLNLDELITDNKEIYLSMGYHGNIPDKHILDLLEEVKADARNICTPCCMYKLLDGSLINGHTLSVQDKFFDVGYTIMSYLKGVSQVCLFVATAGREYESYLHQLREKGDIVKEFVGDSLGTVIAEACVSKIIEFLQTESQLKQSMPCSPGYCGWNITEQKKLFDFFPTEPCGIKLSDSFLMSPIKSVSGIIGLGKSLKPQPYRCHLCNNKNCYKRKEKI